VNEYVQRFRAAPDRERLALVRDIAAGRVESPPAAALKSMLADEQVPWIRMALEDALASQGIASAPIVSASDAPTDDDAYTQALNTAIRQVLHEIAPVVGRARLAARRQLGDDLAGTTLNHELESLARICDALRRLAAASAVPNPQQIDLAECLHALVAAEASHTDVPIRTRGTSAFLVSVDRALLELAIVNLLRNAIEATEALGSDTLDAHAIVVTWGEHRDMNWVSVIDRGQGLMSDPHQLFDRGVSLKSGGRGYGLTTTVHAARSLRGNLEIGTNEQGGTTATLTWPSAEELP
jgi:signal transduction histidine kinase